MVTAKPPDLCWQPGPAGRTGRSRPVTRWEQVGTGGHRWAQVGTDGHRWVQVDTGGHKWVWVGTGGKREEAGSGECPARVPKPPKCRAGELLCSQEGHRVACSVGKALVARKQQTPGAHGRAVGRQARRCTWAVPKRHAWYTVAPRGIQRPRWKWKSHPGKELLPARRHLNQNTASVLTGGARVAGHCGHGTGVLF